MSQSFRVMFFNDNKNRRKVAALYKTCSSSSTSFSLPEGDKLIALLRLSSALVVMLVLFAIVADVFVVVFVVVVVDDVIDDVLIDNVIDEVLVVVLLVVIAVLLSLHCGVCDIQGTW